MSNNPEDLDCSDDSYDQTIFEHKITVPIMEIKPRNRFPSNTPYNVKSHELNNELKVSIFDYQKQMNMFYHRKTADQEQEDEEYNPSSPNQVNNPVKSAGNLENDECLKDFQGQKESVDNLYDKNIIETKNSHKNIKIPFNINSSNEEKNSNDFKYFMPPPPVPAEHKYIKTPQINRCKEPMVKINMTKINRLQNHLRNGGDLFDERLDDPDYSPDSYYDLGEDEPSLMDYLLNQSESDIMEDASNRSCITIFGPRPNKF